ncbi:fumarylacetoacetase [Cokeromyces recurvatus]|uniref:fumarylacetoacetase n=1 Tax=Cokeromyces recurvatus TaxID=90255 RepID=UPI00221FAE2D|nr:fumarylacetoacetase [Cokeromyces recurvatus]KAI7900608.1 fumarylacetoacetase [Cokeromyces recurvatus]
MSPIVESFISVSKDSDFPIQNIPFGVFSTKEKSDPRIGTAIGDKVLDLYEIAKAGLLDHIEGLNDPKKVFSEPSLNKFMELGRPVWKATRLAIQNILSKDNSVLRDNKELLEKVLVSMNTVKMHLPAKIGDYTDFYCSREHATNVGIMFRGKDNALQPNWLHIPVGYHGRASSVIVSGTDIRRPAGQRLPSKDSKTPIFGPSTRLDIELEVGWFVGTGNKLGERVDLKNARDHIFGLVLVNDWSARDIQAWEYVPLGPFLGKSFGTTISPWIVTLDALEPFLVDGPDQSAPSPLPYLQEKQPSAYDINLQVQIKPAESSKFETVTVSNLKHMYWSITQQLAHHTVNGCNLRPGDMGATGTISGPEKGSYGSLLEITWSGQEKIKFEDGIERVFLQDGDEVKITGQATKENLDYHIGFGNCSGKILPCLYENE